MKGNLLRNFFADDQYFNVFDFSVFQLTSVMKLLEDLETKEAPEEEKDRGLQTMEDVTPYITSEQKQNYTEQFQVTGYREMMLTEVKNW